ncbi:MAG: hypothetical protein OXC05_16585 [Halieaceae bacterium]|nr:hypothetical protein [Halieaceae bacterium]
MSNELIAILSVGIALAALMLTQNRNLRADLTKRIEDLRTDLTKRIEDQGTALGKRLDIQALEIVAIRKDVHALGERMAHLDGLVEGLKEAVVARVAA